MIHIKKTIWMIRIFIKSLLRVRTDMFKTSDVISLHVHVTEETKYMINKELLGYM
jgi:lactate dehydrogenase-like 2-hydroxyacid dehydrogenase